MGARWYDPALGRWIQPDAIVPSSQGVQAWDRFAYVNNNPVIYSDPTGQSIWPVVILGAVAVVGGGWLAAHAFGWVPDYRGIATAQRYMNPTTDSITVAAGIAVQSEWYLPIWDSHSRPGDLSNSGLGIAQVSDGQMEKYGLAGQNQDDPYVSVKAMGARIEKVQAACKGCGPRDLLVAAALAQNGDGFSAGEMRSVLANYKTDGQIDWARYFNARDLTGNPMLDLRARGHHQFDTRFMLHLYLMNLRELYEKGWSLPAGITEDDLDYLEDLAE